MVRLRRRAGALIAVAAVTASSALVLGPARADGTVAACHWIDREYSATYTCEDPVESMTHVDIVECWKFPASPRTYVRQKTSAGWVRNPDITVKVTGAKGCEEPYSFRTVVRVPGDLLTDMVPLRLRLTMPAASGTLPDGTPYSFRKTVVTYGACLMPEDAGDWCPER